MELTPTGTDDVTSPQNQLEQHFPPDLKDVFFTDGDRALSFIEGPRAEQQQKVRSAIERMMGLSLIEKTLEHVKKVETQLRQKISQETKDSTLDELERQLEKIDERLPEAITQREKIEASISSLKDLIERANKELQEALEAGNREELKDDLVRLQNQRAMIEKQKLQTERLQADLLSSEHLGRILLKKPLQKAADLLGKLKEAGHIPNKMIPILQDRLNQAECICGESLGEDDPQGKARRTHICKMIEQSRSTDALKGKISDLYYSAQPLLTPPETPWPEQYADAFSSRQDLLNLYKQIGEQEAELETKISKIPDINIQRLKDMIRSYDADIKDAYVNRGELDNEVKTLNRERNDLDIKFKSETSRKAKSKKLTLQFTVASDIRQVFERSLDRMKIAEVAHVSKRMNELFIEMIGADSDSALITKAEIGSDFRILVYDRNDKPMDPSQDLNGASRRALTMAFILALTEVSQVDAPNVIDTPLGMMSGYVKTQVVQTASRNSSQLILFLTHDEIKGCEELLDERADSVCTITNPAHYPKILKNDPGTKEARALLCSCTHRKTCTICDRRDRASVKTTEEA
tara:strand:- start:8610 stop:10346 length:1737 start_codon:yes stop_codon:yes gene_type:complete